MMTTLIILALLAGLIVFSFYQVVRQDDRLDKARGAVRFLLILFILCQIIIFGNMAYTGLLTS